MLYKGILFDFNGVLFWDADVQAQSWRRIAKDLRGREMTEEELATYMHGRPNADVLSYLVGRAVTGQELTRLIQMKESLYRELCMMSPRRFVLSPGARDLLDTLAQAGIPRTIATSSEATNVKFFIQHLRLNRWFDVAKIVYDDGVRPGKPAPDIYVVAAEKIGLTPGECVVIEDSVSGLAAARAAGVGYLVALGAPATHTKLLGLPGVARAIESLGDFPLDLILT